MLSYLRAFTLFSLFYFHFALATFGVTSGSGYLSIDTNGGLVFRGELLDYTATIAQADLPLK
jgi:hypothetical protein